MDFYKMFQDLLFLDVPTVPEYQGFRQGDQMNPINRQSIKYFENRQNYYDADTFVMRKGDLRGDGFLSAFDIMSMRTFYFRLTYTNIDLGPPNWLAFIGLLLIPAIIIILAVGIPVYMLRKRKRKTRE
jgi:hypothetical protein